MKYKRENINSVLAISDEEAMRLKDDYKKQWAEDLYILLNQLGISETDKLLLEVEYDVVSKLKLNKTVAQYKDYIQKLVLIILKKGTENSPSG